MSKSARLVARAVEHYIAVLEIGRSHVVEDQFFFDNDIAMLSGLIPILAAGNWPENWRDMDSAPKDRLIRLGGNGWSCEGRWSEANYVGVGDPKWITVDAHALPGQPVMWAMIPKPTPADLPTASG